MFNVFSNSTTAYADEVMANFYHVGQGDRLPLAGANLEPTDSSLDIGSSTFKWSKGFCDTLNVYNTITSDYNYRKVYSQEIASTVGFIDISGLNGDDYNYIISGRLNGNVPATTVSYLTINTTTAMNFHSVSLETQFGANIYRIVYYGNSIYLAKNITPTTSAGLYFWGELYCKTGQPKIYMGKSVHTSNGFNQADKFHAISKNTADTLTSIRISFAQFTGRITLWEIPN